MQTQDKCLQELTAERVGCSLQGFHVVPAHTDSTNGIICEHVGYFGIEYSSFAETSQNNHIVSQRRHELYVDLKKMITQAQVKILFMNMWTHHVGSSQPVT